ncbi:hypothetical protein [Sorangium sp. So ce388]|uniref:hypothetical protein n=1 Tax=Sorangium sp. So ce388 TaxID=3133309 RepID=UPI003F5AE973
MLTKTFTTPAPSWPTGLRYIQNGDDLNTGNHESQAADVAQALSYLKATVSNDATVPITLADVTVTAAIKTNIGSITRVMPAYPTADDPAAWSIDLKGIAEQATDDLAYIIYWLDIPHGATLTAVSVDVFGASGHSSLPTGTDRAHLEVGRVISPTGDVGLGDAYDASASVGAYEGDHPITVSVAAHVVNRQTGRYYALVRGERGTNFVAGFTVRNVKCTFTPSVYDPG